MASIEQALADDFQRRAGQRVFDRRRYVTEVHDRNVFERKAEPLSKVSVI